MSAQTDGPLIPMPELTPDALRAAVARIAPSRIPGPHSAPLRSHDERTADAEPRAAAGLRTLLAVFVAIERHPERAARLRELEQIVDAGEQDPASAVAEIHAIREAAEAEAGLGRTGPGTTTPVPGTSPMGCHLEWSRKWNGLPQSWLRSDMIR